MTPHRNAASALLLATAAALAGCATTSGSPPAVAYDDPPREIAATPAAEPPRAVEVVTIPEPLPLPGQLKSVGDSASPPEPSDPRRSEEHTSELQSLMRISYAVFCLKKKKKDKQ